MIEKPLKDYCGYTDRNALGIRGAVRRGWLAAAAMLFLGSTYAVAARDTSPASRAPADRHPIEQTGVDFVQLSPAEREAYAAGFILGAATVQALEPEEGLAEALDGLRARRKLIFPYRPNVYAATLREYYTSAETVDERIAEAMASANEHLKAGKGEL